MTQRKNVAHILVLSFLMALVFVVVSGVEFPGYRGQPGATEPDNWYKLTTSECPNSGDCKVCVSDSQSPIEIKQNNTVYNRKLHTIRIRAVSQGDPKDSEKFELINYGLSLTAKPVNYDYIFKFNGKKYKIDNFLLHWRGAEHQLLDKNDIFLMELQIVAENMDDSNDDISIAYLFKYSNEDNSELERIIKYVPMVRTLPAAAPFITKKEITINFNKLVPFHISKYYFYHGSSTLPPCTENVKWMVVVNPILTVSERQIVALQTILNQNGAPVLTNQRPVQSLNGRRVSRSFH